ncbi:MAG: carbamoyltransferase HypF [Candidatus Thiodiazotropha sp.]
MGNTTSVTAVQLRIGGQVQGVGFRPFIYRLASRFVLNGWVENCGAEVLLLFEGGPNSVEAAVEALLRHPPPLAQPTLLERATVTTKHYNDFIIRPSRNRGKGRPHIPPDYFLCDDCLRELNTPTDRRYRYPFINCTQCGPRYTLIERLPYDRRHTTMAQFPLCPACQAEYDDPLNRRFHAEPVACPDCGPQLSFRYSDQQREDTQAALDTTLSLLRAGEIVAVKGIGGYHLMCDARNEEAIHRLRQRKSRPDKPLAVMFPQTGADGLDALRMELLPSEPEAELLRSAMRPIVLCQKDTNSTLARNLAPGLSEIGAMLPYSPLHHLLLQGFGGPLVATSGNLSGEPVLTVNREADSRLARIADGFLHHNRPIRRPADDPVYRQLAGKPRPLRLGRGNAPLEHSLPFTLERPLLAVGGEMKNSIALAWEDRLVLSPHIGELHSPRALDVFEQVVTDLQRLYGIEAHNLVHDAHPDYHATRWARASGRKTIAVYHHHAHASALYGEHWPDNAEPWLVATWDGVGYGPDGTLWGGETLFGTPGNWQRFGRLRPFRLAGSDRAGREPWRSALALCLESGRQWPQAPAESELLEQAWQRGLNSPLTTAAGRLFDAASALLGLGHTSSFEGQGPMALEAVAGASDDYIGLPLQRLESSCWQNDWEPLLDLLLDQRKEVAERAAMFHNSLARCLLAQALKAREVHAISTVGLNGGVFQNRRLTEQATALLQQAGFEVQLAQHLPCNDGGLAWGQIIDAASRID